MIIQNIPKYLVFEGGGVKGFAYTGAISELEKLGVIENINGFAGTSIGALFAIMLCIGYTSDEIKYETNNIDLSAYISACWISILLNIWKNLGVFKLNNIENQFRNIISKKINPEITLGELFKKNNKELVIVSCCLNKKQPIYFHHNKFPSVKLIDALLCSISVPLVFQPKKYNFLGQLDYYIDGGVVENYPLWIFNDIKSLYNGDFTNIRKKDINPYTLGLKVLCEDESNSYIVYNGRKKIKGIFNYINLIIDTLLLQAERSDISYKYIKQTIAIPTGNINFLDFDINQTGKILLINSGIESVRNYYNL